MKDDALYLEVDEDITSAIDKLGKSPASSVQIVVPKRSTMLQSIINLKLLKKAAENSGKELVLVTNDRLANDLAGRVGLAVAPSLGAKAVINHVPMPEDLKSVEEVIEADDPEPPAQAPVPAKPDKPAKRPMLRRRDVSDEPSMPPVLGEPTPEATAESAAVAPTGPAGKMPRVPDFRRLQRRALWAGLAVLLIGGYFAFMAFYSSAKVTLYVNGSKVDIDTTFSVDPGANKTDTAAAVLAGQTVTVNKDLTGTFTPTGKKDIGTKASGQMTISNCLDEDDHTFVSGTRFNAPDGKVFRSTSDIVVPGGKGSFFGCTKPGTATVNVQADQNGDSYNEGPATYTIPGLPASQQAGSNSISAKGGQMAGGTSKTVTVVTQGDIDDARDEAVDKDKDNALRDLKGRAPSGYTLLDPSQATAVASASSAPALDAEGSTATLTLKLTYTALAVKQSEYQDLIRAQEIKQLGDENQIYDDGIGAAELTVTDKSDGGKRTFHFTTEAYGGHKLDTKDVASQLKGQRYGDAAAIAAKQPGVTKADIALKPGWATSLPKRASNINITIQVTGTK